MKKDILQDIIANKRIEVARQKQAVSLQTLLALGSDRMSVTHVPCVRRWNHPPPVLSPSSSVKPSKGWLHPGANIASGAAYEAGAVACITERPLETDHPYILVEDSLAAFQGLAEFYKSLFSV